MAHALVGASLSVTLWPERRPAALVVGALLALCPDADYLLGRLHGGASSSNASCRY